jgi:hypothetical protein
MFELADTRPDSNVQEAEYQRLLGFPRNRILEGRVRELADWARQWYAAQGKPWIYALQTDALQLTDDRLSIGKTEFSSKQLFDQFTAAHAKQAVLVAVSAGPECEEKARTLWQEGKPDEYFFLEMFGSAVVEHLITVANGRICGWADTNGMVALPHYSPGYSGWDVSDQNKLWELIRPINGRRLPGELHVLDTGMLRPKKSLLAVVGMTANLEAARRFAKLVPCEGCALPGCQYRRSPYKHSLPQVEDVHRLQGSMNDGTNGSPSRIPLTRGAKYSVNPRALRKWSQERLELRTQRDGSVEARFRYEGTTCTNLGQSLEFHYQVKLSPAQDNYRIIEKSCAPAPGDTGHTQQCEYLNDAASLMGSIANEKPLLGQPLNDVLNWKRPPNPSGCYCDIERRNHKWGLVFEVIHFALAEQEPLRPAASRGQV